MKTTLKRAWDRNNNRMGYAVASTDKVIDGIWLGTDKADAERCLAEVIERRNAAK